MGLCLRATIPYLTKTKRIKTMEIKLNSYVSVQYTLTVDGQVADQSPADRPLEFVFGMGMLLPKFEENILGKKVGDKVAFTLAPSEGYGETMTEAIVELPRGIFEVEGKLDEEIVKAGAILPMMDAEGNQMPGRVIEVKAETIAMDFNPPMAGKTLNFEVEVVGVRETTDEDMAKFAAPQAGGCGCGCDDGDCSEEEGGCCGSCNS